MAPPTAASAARRYPLVDARDPGPNGFGAAERKDRELKLQSVLDAVQAPPPSNFLAVEVLFAAIHFIALVAAVFACAWTAKGLEIGSKPEGVVWLIMELWKLGYPMIPVIFGCWMLRAAERCRGGGRKMTSGYYFNNLKMGLLPSLGYGFLVNFIFKHGILAMISKEVLPEIMLDFLGPAAWVFGMLSWWAVSHCIDTGVEAGRPDFGFYPRWRVERGRRREGEPAPPVKELVHKGPHVLFRVIPTPVHGTLLKILRASLPRMIGITLLASIFWFSGVLWCLVDEGTQRYWMDLEDGHSSWKVILCTDMLNLMVNIFTAPLLILWGWRSEPRDPAAASTGGAGAGGGAELPLEDEATERAELLKELWNDLA